MTKRASPNAVLSVSRQPTSPRHCEFVPACGRSPWTTPGAWMGRFPRVMPANAGIQDTTTLTEFRLLATPARRKLAPPRRVPLDTRFRGYDKAGFPERCALCFLIVRHRPSADPLE